VRRDGDNASKGNDLPAPREGVTRRPKFWVGAGFAAVLLVFAVQNHDLVLVHYVFFDHESYLIWVMLGCGVIGFVVGWLWGRPARVRSKRSRKGKKPNT
jgi:uncharacterized integral membrane protein